MYEAVSQRELFFFFFIICERLSLHDSPLWVLSSVPTAAPRDIAVEVFNTTVLRVSWTPAPSATVRGHLGGYHVSKHWLAGSTTFFRLLKKRMRNKVQAVFFFLQLSRFFFFFFCFKKHLSRQGKRLQSTNVLTVA